jgi:hypothetical protein
MTTTNGQTSRESDAAPLCERLPRPPRADARALPQEGAADTLSQGAPGTDDFWQEYLAWKNGKPAPIGGPPPGTFDDLISQFYRVNGWNNIPKESTKATYRGELERFRATYGKRRRDDDAPRTSRA